MARRARPALSRPAWERRRAPAPTRPERDWTSRFATAIAQGVPVVIAALIAAFIAVFTNSQSQRATNIQLRIAGQTLVTVTHDSRVAATADRLISMRDGAFVDETRLTGGTSGSLTEITAGSRDQKTG